MKKIRGNDLTGRRFGSLTAVRPTDRRKAGYTIWQCVCDCGNDFYAESRALLRGTVLSCGCRHRTRRCYDLAGRRFGRLTVRELVDAPDRYGRAQWLCECDCGNTVVTTTSQLLAGNRKSCGCLREHPQKDLTGLRFGRLTVLAFAGAEKGKRCWHCSCDCGSETDVYQSNLLTGHTQSCGCMVDPMAGRTFVAGTCLENIRSTRIYVSNTSGVRGVYFNKKTGKWAAQITFRGKTKYLGSFDQLGQAAAAREKGQKLFEDLLAQYAGTEPPCELERSAIKKLRQDTVNGCLQPSAWH